MTRQRSKRARSPRRTLPTRNNPSQRKLEAIVHRVVSVTIDQNIEEAAKAALREATESATLQAINGQQAFANENGAMILERLARLEAETADLRSEVAVLRSENAVLRSEVAKLQALTKSFLEVRERAFDTWLRDYWRDNSKARQRNIRRLNKNVVHGGNAYADAQMVVERQGGDSEYQKFVSLYGLKPEVVIHLALSDRQSILKVLDFVGTIHLSRQRLREEERSILECIVDSISVSGTYDEAEELSKQFPF